MESFEGDLVFVQMCDATTMCFHRIPDVVRRRAKLFLRNHWPANADAIPEDARDRTGFVPPMARAYPVRAGRQLADRQYGALFFGTNTGPFFRFPNGDSPREATVRALRASGLPFTGGISRHEHPLYKVDPELVVERVPDAKHRRMLADAKICLAPWGNHPITYRFFEGFASRCLVIAQSLRDTRFLDGGLVPGVHYLEVAPDLSDLVPTVERALGDLRLSQRIADAGHELFRRRLAHRGRLASHWVLEETVRSWRGLYPLPGRVAGFFGRARALVARRIPDLF
jgi:hypothetical protein